MKRSAVLLLVLGCATRTPGPRPAVTPATARELPPALPPPLPTPFHVIVRAPAPLGAVSLTDTIGAPLPLVERTSDGGLVFASEYAHAVAAGAEALHVDALMTGLHELMPGRFVGETADGTRWLRGQKPSDALIAREQWAIGGGPRLDVFRRCGNAWTVARRDATYSSPVRRGDSALAIEHRVESESGGDPRAGSTTRLKLPRIVRLEGPSPVPSVPSGVCPEALAAASDGALLVVGTTCPGPTRIVCEGDSECQVTPPGEPGPSLEVVRYAPGSSRGTHQRLSILQEAAPHAPALAAVARDELYVAAGGRLHRFDGEGWSASPLPARDPDAPVVAHALAASPSGTLWLALLEGAIGRVYSRARGATIWQEVALPSSPDGPLDDDAPTDAERSEFYGAALPSPNRGAPLPIVPFWIDARDEAELLVLGRAGDTTVKEPVYPPGVTPGTKWSPVHRPGEGFEIVLLSTRPRAPALRVPSQLAQVRALRKAPRMKPAPACAPFQAISDPAAAPLAPSSGGPGGLTCCVDAAYLECPTEKACLGARERGVKPGAGCKPLPAKNQLCAPPEEPPPRPDESSPPADSD